MLKLLGLADFLSHNDLPLASLCQTFLVRGSPLPPQRLCCWTGPRLGSGSSGAGACSFWGPGDLSLPALRLASEGSEEMKALADVTVACALCLSAYAEQGRFPAGIQLQKQGVLVSASRPTLLAVMERPCFLRRQNQGSSASAFNCLCAACCLECLPLESRGFQGGSVPGWVLHQEKDWILLADFVWCSSELVFPRGYCFLYNSDIVGSPPAGLGFWNCWARSGDGFVFTLQLE